MIIILSKFLKILNRKKLELKIEHRVKKGINTYGVINQAEFKKYINPADNDLWDIVIPGYNYKIRKKNFLTNDIIGIFYLDSGNHKFFMRIDHPGFSKKKSTKDIKIYIKNYKKITKINGIWIPYNSKKFKSLS